MRKVIAYILGAIGVFLLIGAAGGLDQDLCTYAEFWRLCGISFVLVILGAICAKDSTDSEN